MRRSFIQLALLLTGLSALRWLIGLGADLIPDEAYYWAWSLRPDVCYWDQPGGIAYAHYAWGRVFGDSLGSLRALAVCCSLLVSLLLFRVLRRVMPERHAFWSVLVLQTVPLFSAGAVLILHDSLLLVFSIWVVDVWLRTLLEDRPKYWLPIGVLAAAAMYAKFSAVILFAGLALAMLLHPTGRRQLRTWYPYLGAMLGLALFLPVLTWNARHQWVAYHAVRRLSFDPDVIGWQRLVSVLDYLGGQLGVVTPILAGLGLAAAWSVLREHRRPETAPRLLLVVPAVAMLVYFLVNSFRAKIQANWPAVAWLLLVPLGMDWLWRQRAERPRLAGWLARGGVGLAVTATLLLYAQVFTGLLPLPKDMTDQFYGWRDMARYIAQTRTAIGRPDIPLAARSYQTASELLYHLPERPDFYMADFAHRGSQFSLWQNYENLVGRDVLFIDEDFMPGKYKRHFAEVVELGSYARMRGKKTIATYTLFWAKGFRLNGPETEYMEDAVQHHIRRAKNRETSKNE